MDTCAWIVSDDVGLADDLEGVLAPQAPCDFVGVTFDRWISCQEPPPSLDCLFLDLRNGKTDSVWQHLSQFRKLCERARGRGLPSIGIVRHGLDPKWAVNAEQKLTATLPWPCSKQDLKGLAEVLDRQASRDDASPVSRVLESRSCRFLTYTPALFSVLDGLVIAAKSHFTILLIGETGTGKTTLARIIHEMSPRHERPFLPVACGALPGELIDSELFGHERGAFTGAEVTKEGKFDAAHTGTLLLDEIDVLGLRQQAKLLRVLETGEFEPVGSNETHKVNTRVVAASNVCLQSLVSKQEFRADLYYRLDQVKFEIPPLRKRPRDIVPLTVDIIEECCRENDLTVRSIHTEFLDVLKAYSWPGNIRELRNEVRRAAIFCRHGILTPDLLSKQLLDEAAVALRGDQQEAGLASEVAQTERDLIEQMLKAQNFNRAATARALGISRVTLYNKIRKYGICMRDR